MSTTAGMAVTHEKGAPQTLRSWVHAFLDEVDKVPAGQLTGAKLFGLLLKMLHAEGSRPTA